MRKIWNMEAELRKDVHVIESKELRECLDKIEGVIRKNKDILPKEVHDTFYDCVSDLMDSRFEREELIKEYSRAVDEMAWYGKGDMFALAKMAKKLGRLSLTDDLAERKQALVESRGAKQGVAPCPLTR